MTFTWKLNSAHDLAIGTDGKFEVVTGTDQVRQRILVALRHFYREYFLDVPDGIPWYEAILGSKNRKNAELILRKKVLDVPGVIGIVSMDLSFSNAFRSLTIKVKAEVQGSETSEIINLQWTEGA